MFTSSGGFRCQVGRLSKTERQKNGWGEGGREVFKTFRSHIILKDTPVVKSRVWSKLIFAPLWVILRLRVIIIHIYVHIKYFLGVFFHVDQSCRNVRLKNVLVLVGGLLQSQSASPSFCGFSLEGLRETSTQKRSFGISKNYKPWIPYAENNSE